MWEQAAAVIVRYRWVLVTFLFLALIASIPAVGHLEMDLSFRGLAGRSSDHSGRAPETDAYLVAVLRGQDVFRPEVLDSIAAASAAIEEIPRIDEVRSLSTVRIIRGEPGERPYMTAADLVRAGDAPEEIERYLSSSPLYARWLTSEDGNATLIAARLAADHVGLAARQPTIEQFRNAIEQNLPPGFEVRFTGLPIADEACAELVWRGFLAAQALAIMFMAAVLWRCFRRLVLVVLPLAIVTIATLLTLGFMTLDDQRVTLIHAAIPLFLLIIGVGETSFFLARYRETRAGVATSGIEAVKSTLTAVLPAGFAAAATTGIGFASMIPGRSQVTSDFALTMAVGVLVTFITTVCLLPWALALVRPSPPQSDRDDPLGRLMNGIVHVILNHRKLIWLVAGAIVVAGISGAMRLQTMQYATKELDANHPVRLAQEAVDRDFMGAFQTRIEVRASDGGSVLRPAHLQQLHTLQQTLSRQAGVIRTRSVADFLRELNASFDGVSPIDGTLPETEAAAKVLLYFVERQPEVKELISVNRKSATIMVHTGDMGTGNIVELGRAATVAADGDLTIRIAGDYWEVSSAAEELTRDVVASTALSLFAIFALVWWTFGSSRLMLVSILPNLLPLFVAVGMMGWLRFDLRVGTSIVLPVFLGLAIDATVHYVIRFRSELEQGELPQSAIRRSLQGTGRGMLIASVTLIAGFACLLVPDFVVFHHVAVLAIGTLSVALLADLFLLPSLLLTFQSRLAEPAVDQTRVVDQKRVEEGRRNVLVTAGVTLAFIGLVVMVDEMQWMEFQLGPVLMLLSLELAFDLILAATARHWAEWPGMPWAFGAVQVILLTVLLHYFGGVELGVYLLVYGFLVLHMEVFRSARAAFFIANFSAACYGLLAWLETAGVVTPAKDVVPGDLTAGQRTSYVIFAFLSLNVLSLFAYRYGRQLRRLAHRLQERVAEQTADLRLANHELAIVNRNLADQARVLEEHQKELKAFAYIVSHDLKNPISAILLNADLLRKREGAVLSVEGAKKLERITSLASETEDMIRDLLSLFRVVSIREQPEWIDTNTLVENALETLSPMVATKGARVTVAELPRIWGRPKQLSHVFVNLLSNAVKYVPTEVGRIEVDGAVQNGHVFVDVRDNGIGIAKAYHEGIFRLFCRVPAGERMVDGRPVDGTGVGLAIVKRIVETHGGLIELTSAPGRGSNFRIRLPSMRH